MVRQGEVWSRGSRVMRLFDGRGYSWLVICAVSIDQSSQVKRLLRWTERWMDECDTLSLLRNCTFVSGCMQCPEEGLTGSESTETLFILWSADRKIKGKLRMLYQRGKNRTTSGYYFKTSTCFYAITPRLSWLCPKVSSFYLGDNPCSNGGADISQHEAAQFLVVLVQL